MIFTPSTSKSAGPGVGEAIDLPAVELAVIEALNHATKVHDELGVEGAKAFCTNAFGETALECDVRCEEVVIRALERAGFSGDAYTEEHGIVHIGRGADFTFTLDGLDGTRRYHQSPGKERYATMLAVLRGANPTYDDYIVCASKEHANGVLYIARQAGGGNSLEAGVATKLAVSGVKELDAVRRSYIDAYWPFNEEVYRPLLNLLNPEYLKASCIYYHDLISGCADLVLECTRKRNLELACAYGLIKEAGGAVELLDGSSLGQQRYCEFGQIGENGDVHIAVISAASRDLAAAARKLIIGD